MNKSEIAEKAAREIYRHKGRFGTGFQASEEAELAKIVERAIAESQSRTVSDLDWDTICAERDHWRAIAVKAVPGCNAPFGEDEDITMEDVIGKIAESQAPQPERCNDCLWLACVPHQCSCKCHAELGDGEPSPKYYCACCKNLCEKPGIWCNYCFTQIAMNSKHKCGAAQEVSPPSPEQCEDCKWHQCVPTQCGCSCHKSISTGGDTRELKAALRESAYLMSDKGFDELDVEEWDHRAKAIRDLAELLG